jgi:hypothetical protein
VNWLRVAAFERDWFLVDIAVVMSIAVWVPGGYRPLWLPLLFASGAVLVTLADRILIRALGSLTGRMRTRTTNSSARIPDEIAWPSVRSAFAFKRDLFTRDLICLALVTPEGVVEFNECDATWSEVIAALPARLPGSVPYAAWYLDVAAEPFAPRVRQIYGEPTSVVPDLATVGASPPSPVTVRDYLGAGTTVIFLAIALLLAVIGILHGPRVLASLVPAIVAYMALSRAAVFCWFAVRGAGTA